ncbi:hypothetical protein SLS53_009413 [Cytospora paraplurivora]
MPFSFSFSSSATFVSTGTVNGQAKGYAYQRQSYSTPQGSGVRTTKQRLGEAPLTETRLYDHNGREMLANGSGAGNSSAMERMATPSTRIISIEDVTEEEEEKATRLQKRDNV